MYKHGLENVSVNDSHFWFVSGEAVAKTVCDVLEFELANLSEDPLLLLVKLIEVFNVSDIGH